MSHIIRVFNNHQINQRLEDGYINLNEMANSCNKRVDNWFRLQSTKDLLETFALQNDNGRIQPLIALKGGSGGGGGSYAHPDIAIQFAQWCSPTFALQVSRWVREWLTTGQNPTTVQQPTSANASNQATLEQIDYIFAGLTKLGIKSELVESAKLTAVAQIFPNLAAATESAKALLSSKMAIEDIPLSPTKIGELLAKELHLPQIPSARLVNQALVDRGLQTISHHFNSKGKKKISYHLTERGEAFGQMQLETAHNCSKTLTIVRWFPKVVQEIKNYFNRT